MCAYSFSTANTVDTGYGIQSIFYFMTSSFSVLLMSYFFWSKSNYHIKTKTSINTLPC